MALDTRLIGKALGLTDPIDIGRTLEPAIQKGERRFAEERARQERQQVRDRQEQIRQEENTARAISVLSNINAAGVAEPMRPAATKAAKKIRQNAIEAIKNADNPAAKAEIVAQADMEIARVKAMVNDYNSYAANIADLKPDDVSKLNKGDIGVHVQKLLTGDFEFNDDFTFDFKDGKGKQKFTDIINKTYINKRSNKFLDLIKIGAKTSQDLGLKGVSKQFYDAALEDNLNTVEMSDLDLMSVAVDHFGINSFGTDNINLMERIKEDFDQDGDIDNIENRTKLRQLINNKIKAAKQKAFNTAKSEYDSRVKVPAPTKEDKRISDLQTFMIDFERNKSLFGIGKNQAGVFTGKIDIQNPNLAEALSQINYEIVDKFAVSEEDPTLTSIKIKKIGSPDSKAIEILPNESAQIFARKLMEDRGGTAEEAYKYGYQFDPPIDPNEFN